jgi:hypothetical protein
LILNRRPSIPSIYRRYAIVDQKSLKGAVAQIDTAGAAEIVHSANAGFAKAQLMQDSNLEAKADER